jgi:hypothetical protein
MKLRREARDAPAIGGEDFPADSAATFIRSSIVADHLVSTLISSLVCGILSVTRDIRLCISRFVLKIDV